MEIVKPAGQEQELDFHDGRIGEPSDKEKLLSPDLDFRKPIAYLVR